MVVERPSLTCGLLLVLAVGIAGCGSVYTSGRQFSRGAITPRSAWKASGTLKDPAKALDGDLLTAAVSEGNYKDATLDIDLGEVCLFNMVAIDHGPDEMGFCGRVAAETSVDGKEFTRRAEAPGTRKVTIVSLITPVLARYLRLRAVDVGVEAWSVAEVHLQ